MNGETKENAILARLQSLEVVGRLTPDAIVADAQDEDSPLHECFEWDDSEAAHKFRLTQARGLLERMELAVTSKSHILLSPYYVRDPAAGAREQGYVRTVSVKGDREKALAVVLNELARAEGYMNRVERLATVLGVKGAVNDIRQRMMKLKAELAA
jgi:hypothetical protein